MGRRRRYLSGSSYLGYLLAALLAGAAVGRSSGQGDTADAEVARLADRFVAEQEQYDPTVAYRTGIAFQDQSRLPDRSPRAIEGLAQEEQEDLRRLMLIHEDVLSTRGRATYATLREQLEADLQMRVCRPELWDVNHFDGWQSALAEVAQKQRVATEQDRRRAIQRWSGFPRYVDTEIANLRVGLASGYSAPQSVVRRVISQMNEMASDAPERSPFFSPATRSQDKAFQTRYRDIILKEVTPALRKYRDFLRDEYLPKARTTIGVSELPNGSACYAAFLRANTTLKRTPQEVFQLGTATVDSNLSKIKELGQANYGTSDVADIVARIKSRPAEHFVSKDELLRFSESFLAKAKLVTKQSLVLQTPKQDVHIRPLSDFEEAAGVGSRFRAEPDPSKPAIYLIKLGNYATVTRAEAEISTAHETVPGHYLQKALSRSAGDPSDLAKFVDNPAYAEGWARYAEGLAEEVHIYDTVDASILRRTWAARGMVVDPGFHVFHWSRQQAIDYIMQSGRFTKEEANDYADRIAVDPAQLTSYDTGGLEILSLRREAEAKLGPRFDLRAFDETLTEEGAVPLSELRRHVEKWIAGTRL